MLKLLIDSQEVRLSEDLGTDYFVTNPYFTRTGEHTYDIDIDLSDPVNAAIYGHIDRADVGNRYRNRSALLISEYGVLMRGTEVILQLEDGHAKIQLVAGNSEMNYIAGDSLMLDMLDLGEIETLNASVATQSLSGSYPEWDFVCCPICTFNEEETADYEFIADPSSPLVGLANVLRFTFAQGGNTVDVVSNLPSPQPYIGAILRRAIEALGYTVNEDVFVTDTLLSRMIMLHGENSEKAESASGNRTGITTLRHYNNMVPHWSVAKFFQEVEKFCNVIIDVDHVNKSVNILDAATYFNLRDIEHIPASDVIGESEKKFDDDSDLDMTDYTNIKYNLPDTPQNKYRRISSEASAICTDYDVPVNTWQNALQKICLADIHRLLLGNNSFLDSNYSPATYYALSQIYKLAVYTQTRSFIVRTDKGNFPIFRSIDELADRITDKDKSATVLDMVPVEMISSHRMQGPNFFFHFPMPFLRGKHGTFGGHRTTGNGANDIISDGNSADDEKVEGTLPVAFYRGLVPITWENQDLSSLGVSVPIASPLNELMLFYQSDDDLVYLLSRLIRLSANDMFDMSLNGARGMWNRFYSNNPEIDTSILVTKRFRTHNKLNPRKIFVIENIRYYCKQLKYTLSSDGLSEIVEGEFFLYDKANVHPFGPDR